MRSIKSCWDYFSIEVNSPNWHFAELFVVTKSQLESYFIVRWYILKGTTTFWSFYSLTCQILGFAKMRSIKISWVYFSTELTFCQNFWLALLTKGVSIRTQCQAAFKLPPLSRWQIGCRPKCIFWYLPSPSLAGRDSKKLLNCLHFLENYISCEKLQKWQIQLCFMCHFKLKALRQSFN